SFKLKINLKCYYIASLAVAGLATGAEATGALADWLNKKSLPSFEPTAGLSRSDAEPLLLLYQEAQAARLEDIIAKANNFLSIKLIPFKTHKVDFSIPLRLS
ncbi:MAG: hypothetical protein ACK4M7_08310, partial [Burkholderiales bacterium]